MIKFDINPYLNLQIYLTPNVENISFGQVIVNYIKKVLDGAEWSEVMPLIKKDPAAVYYYAVGVLKERWQAGEDVLLATGNLIILQKYYEKFFQREGLKWPEAEPLIKKSPEFSTIYATNSLRDRWNDPAAEAVIINSPFWAVEYAKLIKGRWMEAEPKLMVSNYALSYYQLKIAPKPWPEFEAYLLKTIDENFDSLFSEQDQELAVIPLGWAIEYAEISRFRWAELEEYLLNMIYYYLNHKDDKFAGNFFTKVPADYYFSVVRDLSFLGDSGAWPELEELMLHEKTLVPWAETYMENNPSFALIWMQQVIGKADPYFETYLEKDDFLWETYVDWVRSTRKYQKGSVVLPFDREDFFEKW